MFNSAP